MTKGRKAEVLSFSVPSETAIQIENLTRSMGYSNRSELIRDSLRMLVKSKKRLEDLSGDVEGVIVAMYKYNIEGQVSELRHHNMDLIRSFMHTDFNCGTAKCCDVLFFSGSSEKVRGLVFALTTLRDVEEVQVFPA